MYEFGIKRFWIYQNEKARWIQSEGMDELMKPNDIVVCRVANHFVPIKQGYYIDSWDSGNKSVYTYWIKYDCIQEDLKILNAEKK